MPTLLTPAIPAAQLVSVVPSVLGAGGNPLQFDGLILDSNLSPNGYPVMPVGNVYSWADLTDVNNYFGSISQEAGLAGVYFNGPTNATQLPTALLMAQYCINEVAAYLRGGNVSATPLSTLQAITSGGLNVTIDGTPVTGTINLSTATSFSNAAQLMGVQLAIKGLQKGTVTATLAATSPHMSVSALLTGPQQAEVVANLSGTTMTVTSVVGGYLAVGQVLSGTGITVGTTIVSYNGAGQPGGVGSYTLSASATLETADSIIAFGPAPTLQIGDVVTGTGISANTYISGFGTGVGGTGTYILSQAPTAETAESITVFAPGVAYSATHGAFEIRSGTLGASSSVSFATGSAAATLGFTAGTGAVQSIGKVADTPATFMPTIIAQTLNWVEFMTTWEPTDTDKEAFANWNNSQGNRFCYTCWETDILDTEQNAGSALANLLAQGQVSGTNLLYTNPSITTLAGEKAAFQLSWTACLNFGQKNGRQTAAYKGYSGGLPDVLTATLAQTLAGSGASFGYGINFYGKYTTANQAFNLWQRGFVSGEFVWKDSYVNQIWLNNELQLAILEGLKAANSVPYNVIGNTLIAAWCADPILQAVNFGAIVAGVQLSQSQIATINNQIGFDVSQQLFNRGWFLQILASTATSQTRGTRSSPPCTLYYVDGGSVQQISLASIEVQ